MTEYQTRRTYGGRKPSRSSEIGAAVIRKEKSIARFVDAKSTSIAVSSAFNGAAQIVTALLALGKVDPKKYWETHDEWYQEYLSRYNEAQDNAKNEAQRKIDLAQEAKEAFAMDTASDESSGELLG